MFRLEELQKNYDNIRRSNIKYSFSLVVAFIHSRCSFQLTHYITQLLYSLERNHITQFQEFSDNIDISIKHLLTDRDSSRFYGTLYPYFDPVRIVKQFSSGTFTRIVSKCSKLVPEGLKYLIWVVISILGFYIDFIKDIIIAAQLSFLYEENGGLTFKNVIVITLWVTVFLSQCIMGLNIVRIGPYKILGVHMSDLELHKRVVVFMFLLVACPVSPALLLFMNARFAREIRLRDKKFEQISKSDINLKSTKKIFTVYAERREVQKKKDRLEQIIARSYLLDVGLENSPQVLIQFIIVLVAAWPSRFPWLAGVEGVFDTHDSSSLSSTLLFYFSIAWSLKSIHAGIFSTFLYQKDYSVGDYGKVLMFANIFIGASSRILAIVLSFVPFIGLFNHMYFHQLDSRLQYSQQLWTQVGRSILLSRQYTWYTGVHFNTFIIILVLSPLLHVLAVVVLYRLCFALKVDANIVLHGFSTLIHPTVLKVQFIIIDSCNIQSLWFGVRV